MGKVRCFWQTDEDMAVITEQHAAERLSRAYVYAIAAKAGLNIGTRDLDYGVDGTFHPVRVLPGGRHLGSGYPLDFQLKASKNWTAENGHIVYDLEAKTFNDFIARRDSPGSTPFILMLLCLPPESEQWCTITEEQLLVRKCVYWFMPTGDRTTNTSSIRIRVPRANLMTHDVLSDMMVRVSKGESP